MLKDDFQKLSKIIEVLGEGGFSGFGYSLQEFFGACRRGIPDRACDRLTVKVNLNDPSSKLMHGIQLVLARNYFENLREEVKKGMREKAAQAFIPAVRPWDTLMTRSSTLLLWTLKRLPLPTASLNSMLAGNILWRKYEKPCARKPAKPFKKVLCIGY